MVSLKAILLQTFELIEIHDVFHLWFLIDYSNLWTILDADLILGQILIIIKHANTFRWGGRLDELSYCHFTLLNIKSWYNLSGSSLDIPFLLFFDFLFNVFNHDSLSLFFFVC